MNKFIKPLIVAGSLLSAGFLFSQAVAETPASPGEKLINAVSGNQLKLTNTFEGPMGLVGHVAKDPRGQQAILFTSKDGKYLIIGNIIKLGDDAKPVNLTEGFQTKYISQPQAIAAMKDITNTRFITDSKNPKAPAMYVLWDPNCSYCSLLFKMMRPLIDAGKLQVRWVPVAIRPQSQQKVAQVFAAKDDAAALALMIKDEKNFDEKTEQGGLQGITTDKAKQSAAEKQAFETVRSNTAFFVEHGFMGTPVMLFHTKDQQVKMIPGFLREPAFLKLLTNMSSEWNVKK